MTSITLAQKRSNMTENTSGTTNTTGTAEQNNRVNFEIVNEVARTWKVLGCLDPISIEYANPPAPLAKDGILRMEEGKFPLTDHRDLQKHEGRGGTYVFTSVTGIGIEHRISGFLDGFTYNCTPPGFDTGGTQIISVVIQSGLTNSSNPVAEAP